MGIFVFDLDQTVVDSSHRTPLVEGKVDVVRYISLQTRENIYKDKILPLAYKMKEAFQNHYVIVCTARKMTTADYEFLEDMGLRYHEIFERGNVNPGIASMCDGEYKMNCLKKYKNTPYTFYDDSTEVIKKFSEYANVQMVDAKIENTSLLTRTLLSGQSRLS